MNKTRIIISMLIIIFGCNSSEDLNDELNSEDTYNEKYYEDFNKNFLKEKVIDETEVKKIIDEYFYKPDEIKNSENYQIIQGLLSSLKIHASPLEVKLFKNKEIAKTERALLYDSSFCDYNVLYTELDTNMIFCACFKYGKIYSIMPIWDGNKEMKITWLR